MYSASVTISHEGHDYTGTVEDGRFTLDRDGVFAGRGTWTGDRIVDCAAVIPEEVYSAIEAAIVEGDTDTQSVEPANMSEHVWLAGVVTDEGVEVQAVCETRESALRNCPEHGGAFPLDLDACTKLAKRGIMAMMDAGGDEPVMANDVLPNVWGD